jgi:hypothetical protein
VRRAAALAVGDPLGSLGLGFIAWIHVEPCAL